MRFEITIGEGGLYQKYTATLGCHSTFAQFIHGGIADVICNYVCGYFFTFTKILKNLVT